MKTISDFALKVAEIEAVAQKSTAKQPDADGESDQVIAQYLRIALTDNDPSIRFYLYLQPKYQRRGTSDVCIGAEALLRLRVDKDFIPPAHFIDIAERSRIIAPIGKMVMKRALEILRDYPKFPRISVNVSPIELLSPNYCKEVHELIAAIGVDPKRLELEITERVVMNDGLAYQHIRELASSGIKISIDDFGTGETRFDYLAKFNVDVIKIDMSLVREYYASPNTYSKLLQAIHAVGRSCKIDVIAEGVEKSKYVDSLHALGIEQFQGYFFGKGVPLTDFIDAHAARFAPSH